MSETRIVREFLDRVWGDQQAYVDLPSKANGHWVPYTIEWPDLRGATRRIETCVDDEEDVYFSPCMFLDSERKAELALPTRWLWADIDRIPLSEKAIEVFETEPTIMWQSSPGKYQGLWLCKQLMSPHVQQAVNHALTRKIKADPGGWDITQVLRVPGTYNYKYSENGTHGAEVYIKWDDGPVYDVKDLMRRLGLSLKDLRTQDLRPSVSRSDGEGEAHVGESAVGGARRQLPRRARTLLNAPVVEGERSEVLFKVWTELIREGWNEDEAVAVVEESDLNKWKGDSDGGASRLGQDYRRAAAKRDRGLSERASVRANGSDGEGDTAARDSGGSEEGLGDGEDHATFIRRRFTKPRWLIEDIWAAGSHGIIAGEPKTMKSTISLCMAVAVASGRPMMSRFKVGTTGPVMMIQEEIDPVVVQDRLRKIESSVGLLSGQWEASEDEGLIGEGYVDRITFHHEDLPQPLIFWNNVGFKLTNDDHCRWLKAKVDEIRPALLILDPLYLMIPGVDENSMSQLASYLDWLRQMRYAYNCAVIVVHHLRKQNLSAKNGQVRTGQRVLGSTTLHGWLDSGIYLDKIAEDSEGLKLRLETEFRAMAPRTPLEVDISMGDLGDLNFRSDVLNFNLEGQVISKVRDAGGSMGLKRLCGEVDTSPRELAKLVKDSDRLGVTRKGRGYMVYVA